MNDTVFALATAPGRAGVAIVRVSGPKAREVPRALGFAQPTDRRASRARLMHDGIFIDEALAIFFQAPRSFTGEDVLELHTHGSQAVTKTLLKVLSSFDGFRLAEAGEFTRRALENDKMDLTQVEGLSDLIDAETESQRKQAIQIFSGALSSKVAQWRSDLIRATSLLEVTIDFADEDIPVDVFPEVQELTSKTIGSLTQEVEGTWAAERIRDGFEVAIVGRPNTGKSSLLNFLAGRDAAITSEIAGTTRDVIEVNMDIRGVAVTFLDTAGLRDAEDAVEAVGVNKARSRAANADLRIVLLESRSEELPIDVSRDDIVLVSKADLSGGDISTKTGEGIDALLGQLADVLTEKVASAGLSVNQRHQSAIESALFALNDAQDKLLQVSVSPEFVVEDLRRACTRLDVLIGRVDVESYLDEIFSSFCIGK